MLFFEVDDFLLLAYYVYFKSPKKCKELEDIVSELKECVSTSDSGGVRPLRACGTRFIARKVHVCTLERILDRLGAHLNRLLLLKILKPNQLIDKS